MKRLLNNFPQIIIQPRPCLTDYFNVFLEQYVLDSLSVYTIEQSLYLHFCLNVKGRQDLCVSLLLKGHYSLVTVLYLCSSSVFIIHPAATHN